MDRHIKFSTLKRKFPIYTDRLSIAVISSKYVDSYINEIKQPYFTEHLDNKNIATMPFSEAKIKLLSLMAAYSMHYNFIYEFRLIIKEKNTNELIGGITIFTIDYSDNFIEIAYWIKPCFQNKGYATESILRIVEFILEIFKDCAGVKLTIQENNLASIRAAIKCGFIQSGNLNGAYGINKIYRIWR